MHEWRIALLLARQLISLTSLPLPLPFFLHGRRPFYKTILRQSRSKAFFFSWRDFRYVTGTIEQGVTLNHIEERLHSQARTIKICWFLIFCTVHLIRLPAINVLKQSSSLVTILVLATTILCKEISAWNLGQPVIVHGPHSLVALGHNIGWYY